MYHSNYQKFPYVDASQQQCMVGWETVSAHILAAINGKTVVAVEYYPGVDAATVHHQLTAFLPQAKFYKAETAMKSETEINQMVQAYVTDDPVFGYMSPLLLKDFFDEQKAELLRKEIDETHEELVVLLGTGASLLAVSPHLLIFADMPRWEIQKRFRKNEAGNLGVNNTGDSFAYLYKRAFFVDWRVCDRHKKDLKHRIDYWLDTTNTSAAKMISNVTMAAVLQQTAQQPFRVMPFFDPGPWGGQWLKEVCDLDRSVQNFAWGFDCVPEENSLLIKFENAVFETPAINLVFNHPEELLGKRVFQAFGDEFPIRFDFLDTMQGGNLSLQVHPLLAYIREQFGMGYTQDESYYFLDASANSFVYLGLKEGINPAGMLHDLQAAQTGDIAFDADKYVEKWPVKKHDHVLIPAGTVHCSGADAVVLEISATPYIFTFKLWDWGRMGLDGKPRPISLAHGKNVIQWDRTTAWTKENLVNRVELMDEGDGWREERTGLDETSFIETRRHWFTQPVIHQTNGTVNVLNLVEGRSAVIESPQHLFEPFVVHYAETFIIPASIGTYTISPYGESAGQQCATMKAYIRLEKLGNYKIN